MSTVGTVIYGGSIQRDEKGNPIIGSEYQNRNSRPGPLYDGMGYSLIARAIQAGPEKVSEVLTDIDLKDDIIAGGARPLHICGMSRKGQLCTQVFIEAGANIYALVTYNYSALHRCASNNLKVGAEALVKAGADPNFKPPEPDSSPTGIALRSRAMKFLMATWAFRIKDGCESSYPYYE